jgi:hypothetical protein
LGLILKDEYPNYAAGREVNGDEEEIAFRSNHTILEMNRDHIQSWVKPGDDFKLVLWGSFTYEELKHITELRR